MRKSADLFDDVTYRQRLLLTDGGVYDNLGLETVWKRLKTLLASDAGAPFDYGGVQGKDWPRETLRVINIFSHQACSAAGRNVGGSRSEGFRRGTGYGVRVPRGGVGGGQGISICLGIGAGLPSRST